MTARLPQLPGTGIQNEEATIQARQQLEFKYKPRDARKVQGLEPVFTLEDLRRTGALGPRGPVQSSLAYPGLTPGFLHEPPDANNSDEDGYEYMDDDDDDGAVSEGSSALARGRRRGRPPPRSPSPDQGLRGVIDPQRYNATAAARSALLYEKPSVVERMEKGVAACAVMRDNRQYRLFSLGVFQPAVNEVRTRSMHRVELHKHLSATTLRAPQADKEVRSAVQHDSVAARLERMYNRVLRVGAAEETAPPSPYTLHGGLITGAGGASGYHHLVGTSGAMSMGTSRRGGGGGVGLRPPSPPVQHASPTGMRGGGGVGGGTAAGNGEMSTGQRSPILTRSVSIKGAPSGTRSSGPPGGSLSGGGGGSPVTGLSASSPSGPPGAGPSGRLLVSVPSMARLAAAAAGLLATQSGALQSPGSPTGAGREREREGLLGGASQRTARSSDYWMRVTMPPEVIEAQLRHLAATTEANLKAYHDKVAAAQDALLQTNGLSVDALAQPTEQVEQSLKVKLGQIQEDTTVTTTYNFSSLSREAILASHLGEASKQLLTATTLPQFIRAALDHVAQHRGELQQLKVPQQEDGKFKSIRRRARSKSAVGPGAAATSASDGGGGGDTARTLSSDATAASDPAACGEDSRDGSSRASDTSGSGIWPSYQTTRHRAISAGQQPHSHSHPHPHSNHQQPHSAGGAGPGAGRGPAYPPQSLPGEDEEQLLAHLRRTASPEPGTSMSGGEGGERRWSPPPPVMLGNARAIPLAPVGVAVGGGGLPGGLLPGGPPPARRTTEVRIDHKWLQEFREQLQDAERCLLDSPPEGLAPLPPLPPGDMDAGAYVRSRLERLWSLLDMPPTMRLDLVLYFTGRDRALQFARHLELWEQAAVAVLGREAQVEALVGVQREIEEGRAHLLSLEQVAGLCLRVLRQTAWVEALTERLHVECGWSLSYHGKPYPGEEAIGSAHLLAFLEQLRQATQDTGLRP